MKSLVQAIEKLRHRPTIGRAVPGLSAGPTRFRVGSHFIYYRFDDSIVEVITVLHIAMDPSLHIGSES